MEFLDECRFCNIVEGRYQHKGIDQPFANSDKFVAIASIGALVEGWSLIVPRSHQLSMRNIYGKSEFVRFINDIIPRLLNRYGPLIAFEHGSNKKGSITACGTDHAHLHLVPYKKSLLSEMQKSYLQWNCCHSSEIFKKTGNSEYLFYAEIESEKAWDNPIGYLHVLETPVSQFFRNIIAAQNGNAETADYRQFPYLETAKQTRKILMEAVI